MSPIPSHPEPLLTEPPKTGASSWSGTASWFFRSKPTATTIAAKPQTPIIINTPSPSSSSENALSSMTSSLTAFFRGTNHNNKSTPATPATSPATSQTVSPASLVDSGTENLLQADSLQTTPIPTVIITTPTASMIDTAHPITTTTSSTTVPHTFAKKPEKKFGWRVKKLFTTLKTEKGLLFSSFTFHI